MQSMTYNQANTDEHLTRKERYLAFGVSEDDKLVLEGPDKGFCTPPYKKLEAVSNNLSVLTQIMKLRTDSTCINNMLN